MQYLNDIFTLNPGTFTGILLISTPVFALYMITQSLLPLSAAGAIKYKLSEVITILRNGVPV